MENLLFQKNVNFILIALLAAYAPAYAAETAAYSPISRHEPQVRDGIKAKPDEFREAVVVEMSDRTFCSGVVIARNAVLSAAHCLAKNVKPLTVTAGIDYARRLDLNGKDYANTLDANGNIAVQTVAVADATVFASPTDIEGGKLAGKDLMVLRLKDQFRDPVKSMSIAPLSNISAARLVRVVGFGENRVEADGKKYYADMTVQRARCAPAAEPFGSPGKLCAEGAELYAGDPLVRRDTCPGDSGGPAYVRTKGGDYRLVGITSRPPRSSMSCGGGTFITLLDDDRLDWIKRQVDIIAPVGELTPELPPPPPPRQPCLPPTCMTM